MDDNHFDDIIRFLTTLSSRRDLLRGATGAGLWLGSSRLPDVAEAKNTHHGKKNGKKRKKQFVPPPLPVNEFGCLDVGQPCRGDSSHCCSGICGGVAPKGGRPDNSAFVAHDVASCTPEKNFCLAVNAVDSLCNLPSLTASCFLTTGSAGFCAEGTGFNPAVNCRVCSTDKECESFGFVAGSACVIIQGSPGCADVCAATQGRGCMPPAA